VGSVTWIDRVAHLTRSGQVRRTDHPLELPHAAARVRIAGTIYRPGFIDNVDSLGKRSKVKVDLGIVRGISYYDGTVFEAYDQAGMG